METRLLILITVILCSCGPKNNSLNSNANGVKVIDLLSKPESKLIELSGIASKVEYIPLETSEKSMIKHIDKVILRENNIYVKNNGVELMCFDKEGHFLYKLDNIGRGPGEYTVIADFDISSDNNTLIFLSQNKIFEFSNTGNEFKFLKSFNLREPRPHKLSLVPKTKGILLSIAPWNGNEPALSIIIDENGDTLSFKSNFYKYKMVDNNFRAANESIHYIFEENVCFKEAFSDTVFSVNKESNKFLPWLILDSHGTILTPRARGDKEYTRNHEFSCIANILEVKRYIFYYYIYKNLQHKVLYDKVKNKKYEIALKDALKDDISGGPDFDIDGCTEEKLYSSVDAITLKEYVSKDSITKVKEKDPEKKEYLRRIADSLNENDNPVLIIVTPKE